MAASRRREPSITSTRLIQPSLRPATARTLSPSRRGSHISSLRHMALTSREPPSSIAHQYVHLEVSFALPPSGKRRSRTTWPSTVAAPPRSEIARTTGRPATARPTARAAGRTSPSGHTPKAAATTRMIQVGNPVNQPAARPRRIVAPGGRPHSRREG
ncbi:hypothetical protein B1L11_28605 [Microbispora sp. GKU 823]|nr:hypothetical protein B1L11_28605 [Microbispora sp. GKU 823]